MSWVAVNKDGSEYMFELEPTKLNIGVDGNIWVTPYYRIAKYDHIEDANTSFKSPLIREVGLLLPKGSIFKLIGRELTWDDEPVELK